MGPWASWVFVVPAEFSGEAWFDVGYQTKSLLQFATSTWLEIAWYALCSVTEEEVEGEHAKVHNLLLGKEARLPDQVCANLRLPDTIPMLRDPRFFAFAKRVWPQRVGTSLKQLLSWNTNAAELRLMTGVPILFGNGGDST